MDDVFQASYLRLEETRQAYPLVRLHSPSITLNQWLAFARYWAQIPERRGGLLALKDVRGYLHALFSYRIETDLSHGKLMRVSDLIIGRLPGRTIDMEIVTAIERLADGIGCSSVVVELAQSLAGPSHVATRSAFASARFTPYAVCFFRQEHPLPLAHEPSRRTW